MKRALSTATAVLLLLHAAEAGAAEPAAGTDRRLFIGPSVSTLGIGGEVGYRLNDYLTLRGGGNAFGYEYNDEIDGVDYDIDLGLASAGPRWTCIRSAAASTSRSGRAGTATARTSTGARPAPSPSAARPTRRT